MRGLQISGATRIAGVVGRPVEHSLSPLLHNAWLSAAGLDGAYVPFSPAPERFASFVEAQRGGRLAGFNITVPYKAEALACADLTDAAARRIGAANLLLFEASGQVQARNTDGEGLLAALAEQAPGLRLAGADLVVLGAGGAARAAVATLSGQGAKVSVVNRTYARAEALRRDFAGIEAHGLEALERLAEGAAGLISASAAALSGETRLAADIERALDRMAPGAVVMDMVYTPLETPLLAAARARALRTVDGLAMLIGQARPSFEALFGRAAPVEVDVRGLAVQALETARS